jgi:hydroxymethylpyrimidine pyrophosphatase-like HAD family hydrolase
VLRCLYVDLDGTLLGRAGSLLHDGEGGVSLFGCRAIEACLRADVEVVLMSGRRKSTMAENARLFGATSYIYEAGSVLVFEGEEHWLTGSHRPTSVSVHDQIRDSGMPALLLERYAGRLEYHDPWRVGQQVTHLFRGLVDVAEVNGLLVAEGHGDLRMLDNGVAHRRSEELAGLDHIRTYHLLPAGASKAAGVAAHQAARGLHRSETMGVGDSREDLGIAGYVGEFWLVANAIEKDPTLGAQVAGQANVRVAEGAFGQGVYEAVVTTLMRQRGR